MINANGLSVGPQKTLWYDLNTGQTKEEGKSETKDSVSLMEAIRTYRLKRTIKAFIEDTIMKMTDKDQEEFMEEIAKYLVEHIVESPEEIAKFHEFIEFLLEKIASTHNKSEEKDQLIPEGSNKNIPKQTIDQINQSFPINNGWLYKFKDIHAPLHPPSQTSH